MNMDEKKDKETTAGKRKAYVLDRNYQRNKTPESLKIDYDYLKGKQGLPITKEMKERIKLLLEDLDNDYLVSSRYSKASLVFILLMIVSLFLPFVGHMVLWSGSLLGLLVIFSLDISLTKEMKQKMGFIDGIFFMLIELDQKLEEFKEQESIKETETLSDIIK